jgi:hypothetical protein
MTKFNYEELSNTISQLTIEEVNQVKQLLNTRKFNLETKPPEYHILDNPDNIKVSKSKVVSDFTPRVEYTISVNQEAVRDHKVLWKQYHIDNSYIKPEHVDGYMDNLIFGFITEKLEKFYNDTQNS